MGGGEKSASQPLAASDDLYAYLFLNSPMPMWVVDRATLEFLEVNKAAESRYGYSREEFLGMRVPDLRPNDSLASVMDDSDFLAAAPDRQLERRHQLRDGREIEVLLTAHGMDFQGRPANLVQVVDVSGIRDAHRERRSSETRLQNLIEQAPISIQVFAPDGTSLSANPAWEELWQTERKYLQGYNVLQDPQLEAKNIAPAIRGAFAGQRTVLPPFLYDPGETGKPGRPRWVEASAYPVLEEAGQLAEVVLLLRDVSDRMEAQAILKGREETLSSFLDSALDAVFVIDADGAVLEWRGAAEGMFGYTAAEARSRQLSDLIVPPQYRDSHLAGLERIRKGGEARILRQRLELSAVRKDGIEFPVELEVTAIPRLGQTVYGAFVRDLSERKRAENEIRALNLELEQRVGERTEELRRERAFLEAVLEDVSDGIVACDADETLRLFNRASREFHGLSAEPIGPESWSEKYDLYEEDGVTPLPTNRIPLLLALREGMIEDVKIVIHPKGHPPIPVSCTGSALYDVDGQKIGAVVVMRDVRERQRLEERNEQLAAAVGELEGFTYSVSHDLRSPLRGIVSNSRILIEDYRTSLPEEARDHLDRLAASALKVARLVDDLLEYARLGNDEVRRTSVQMAELAREVVLSLEEGSCDVDIAIPDSVHVEADPLLVKLALQNLLENACKYRKQGRSSRIVLGVEDLGGQRSFFVKDNGIGFDMQYVGKLFRPFERLHRDAEYKGTGIGLANVRRIVTRHGGRVWAEGVPDQGATFWFTLP